MFRRIDILSLAILLTSFLPMLFWSRLEDVKVPVHFDLFGEPDRWGSSINLLLIAVVAGSLYMLLLLCMRKPQLMNFPTRLGKEQRHLLYPVGIKYIQYLNVIVMILFSYISNSSLLIGLGYWRKMPMAPFVVMIGLILLLSYMFYREVRVIEKGLENDNMK